MIADGDIQNLARNSSWLFLAETLATIFSAIQFPIVARTLGAGSFGIMHSAIGWTSLVVTLFSLEIRSIIVKFLSHYLADKELNKAGALLKYAYLIDFCISVTVFLGLLATAELAADFWEIEGGQGAMFIRTAAFIKLFAMSQGISAATLRVLDRFKSISMVTTFGALLLFVLLVPMLLMSPSVERYLQILAGVTLVQTLALLFLAMREIRGRDVTAILAQPFSVIRADFAEMREMSISVYFSSIRKATLFSADVLILGKFGTNETVGVYKLAKQLADYINRLSNPIYNAIYPEIARLYSEESLAAVIKFVRRIFFIAVAVLIPSLLLVFVFSRPVIPLIFGEEYAPAIGVFLVLVVGKFWLAYIWANGFFLTIGKAVQLTWINIGAALVSLGLMLLLTPRFQAYGMAWAFVGNWAVWMLLITIYLFRLNRDPDFAKSAA